MQSTAKRSVAVIGAIANRGGVDGRFLPVIRSRRKHRDCLATEERAKRATTRRAGRQCYALPAIAESEMEPVCRGSREASEQRSDKRLSATHGVFCRDLMARAVEPR